MSHSSIRPIDWTLSGVTSSDRTEGLVWFGLSSLFNGLSTYVDNFMPKSALYKASQSPRRRSTTLLMLN